MLGTVCSLRTVNGIPRDGEDSQLWLSSTASGSRATSPTDGISAERASTSARKGSKQHRCSHASVGSVTAKFGSDSTAAAQGTETLEEVRKRSERLELMMELMLEQSAKTELAVLVASRERSQSPRRKTAVKAEDSDSGVDGQSSDMDYATAARYLPMAKLMRPAKVAWADPLEALGMEDRWSEICGL